MADFLNVSVEPNGKIRPVNPRDPMQVGPLCLIPGGRFGFVGEAQLMGNLAFSVTPGPDGGLHEAVVLGYLMGRGWKFIVATRDGSDIFAYKGRLFWKSWWWEGHRDEGAEPLLKVGSVKEALEVFPEVLRAYAGALH